MIQYSRKYINRRDKFCPENSNYLDVIIGCDENKKKTMLLCSYYIRNIISLMYLKISLNGCVIQLTYTL